MARVLVVDDDPAIREVIATVLEASGHTVTRASDGGQARAALGAGAIDVVITDLRMPVLSGFELQTHLQTLPRPVPAIILSGTWSIAERERALSLGFARVYEKPANLHQIALDVQQLAQGSA